MARPRTRYCLDRERLLKLLARMRTREGLLLWEALGEDPKEYPGKPETVLRTLRRMQDSLSGDNSKTAGQTVLPKGEEKPSQRVKRKGKPAKPADKPAGKKDKTPAKDPAGAIAERLKGWRAGLIWRARKEKNPTIQRLAHAYPGVLSALLDLAEALPMPRRVPTTLAWLEEVLGFAEGLGEDQVVKVFRQVQKRGVENPLAYAAKVLAGMAREEAKWTFTGDTF
ncbi:MAG: hypothetical protein P3W93_003730 [Thermus sp.]|nr:hypothetical protein [Thermus sp.]